MAEMAQPGLLRQLRSSAKLIPSATTKEIVDGRTCTVIHDGERPRELVGRDLENFGPLASRGQLRSERA